MLKDLVDLGERLLDEGSLIPPAIKSTPKRALLNG